MGNSLKRKKKMGCTISASENDKAEPKIPENPTDLRVLYDAIREADELRQNGNVENAVIILSDTFENALNKLGEVPDEYYKDTMLVMQIIKECNTAWKQKNIAYDPPYRRLRHLKLDKQADDIADQEFANEPYQQPPAEHFAHQNVEEVKQKPKPKVPIKKSAIQFDDSRILKPVQPIEVIKQASVQLISQKSQGSMILDLVDPNQLYMKLWKADKLRIDNCLEEAVELLNESFDDCVYNLASAKKKDRSTINEILKVYREVQHHWENNEQNYTPEFNRLRNLNIDYQSVENAGI